ncbi:RNA polymerase sigma factor [Janibacter sp. G1551]|uniref:RNA polymerase sigma factor n=1 Tax=Janibacter sp. G1551 TaxID=3420440 RepID=UPI003D0217A1
MTTDGQDVTDEGAIERVFREEFGRIVATLTRRLGRLDLAEDMAQEAFAEALRRWPAEGLPPNPGAWLTVTARHRAIDRIRREAVGAQRQEEAHVLHGATPRDPADDAVERVEEPDGILSRLTAGGSSASASAMTDEHLRLFFTCAHPALSPETQAALTLRLLGGLSVAEVAGAFFVPERTMAQRITRAKRKIRDANIPFRVPRDHELPGRLHAVLTTIYLIFNEGYLPSSGDAAIRTDLCHEAIRIARVLRSLMPDEPEVAGLLALLLLTEARRPARVADGVLVTLDEQDRSLWDRELIAEGHALVRECLRRNRPGHHQLLAAVNAVHTDAARASETDWTQVLALYDQLVVVTPTPVARLNRAVALAEVRGPAAGLAEVDALDLTGYHPFHATRADFLRRLGRTDEARAEYDLALASATNPAEAALLRARRAGLSAPPG